MSCFGNYEITLFVPIKKKSFIFISLQAPGKD